MLSPEAGRGILANHDPPVFETFHPFHGRLCSYRRSAPGSGTGARPRLLNCPEAWVLGPERMTFFSQKFVRVVRRGTASAL